MSFLNRIFHTGTQAKIDSLRLELKDLESNAKMLDPIHAMLIRIAEEERKTILKHKYSKYSKLLKKQQQHKKWDNQTRQYQCPQGIFQVQDPDHIDVVRHQAATKKHGEEYVEGQNAAQLEIFL